MQYKRRDNGSSVRLSHGKKVQYKYHQRRAGNFLNIWYLKTMEISAREDIKFDKDMWELIQSYKGTTIYRRRTCCSGLTVIIYNGKTSGKHWSLNDGCVITYTLRRHLPPWTDNSGLHNMLWKELRGNCNIVPK